MTVLAHPVEHLSEIEVRGFGEPGIFQRLGAGHALLAGLARRSSIAGEKEAVSAEHDRPSEACAVADRLGFGFSFAKLLEGASIISQGHTRLADIESQVDRPRGRLARGRQMPERLDRLLEAGRRLDVSRAGGRTGAGLGEVTGS